MGEHVRQGGIAADILNGLIHFVSQWFSPHIGVAQNFVTNGQGSATNASGAFYKILENVDRPVPAFTISNTGSANVKVGWNGVPTFTIKAGASLTLRWKNPARAHLVLNDLGVSGIPIEIIG